MQYRRSSSIFEFRVSTLFVVGCLSTAGFAAEDILFTRNPFLSSPRRGVKPWYTRLYYFTKWPGDSPRVRPTVRELTYINYSMETLLSDVLRADVLAHDWQRRIVRMQSWIPRLPGVTACKLDAYLYRQKLAKGVIHICDTRPFLIIAVKRFHAPASLSNPRETFMRWTSQLLRVKLPTDWTLEYDGSTKLFNGHVLFNIGDLSASKMASGVAPADPRIPAFGLNYYLGHGIVIYEFQKFYVPGCALDPRLSLFCLASDKSTRLEAALAYLEGIRQPSAQDIPRLARTLRGLPAFDPRQQSNDRYTFSVLMRAKYLGYQKLLLALKKVAPSQPEAVPLIVQALDASPQEPSLRGLRGKMELAAIATLKRIHTKQAQRVLRKLSKEAVEPRIGDEAMEAVLKRMPDAEVHAYCLSELEKLMDAPDAQPGKVIFLMRGLPENENPRHVRVLRFILRNTKNEQVRRASIDNLAEWYTDPDEVRSDTLRLLKKHLEDKDINIRVSTIRAVGASNNIRELPVLVPLLDSPDERIRFQAARAICNLVGWKTIPRDDAGIAQLKARLEPVLDALKKLEAAIPQE